jgi:hypothetical protein
MNELWQARTLAALVAILGLPSHPAIASSTAFIASRPEATFQLPEIVLQYDPVRKSGANWTDIKDLSISAPHEPLSFNYATFYLHDGLKRMTGKDFVITSTNDLSKGIVLVLLKNAPADIRADPEVRRALRPDSKDPYASNEAFLIRSERNRVLLVANTADGLTDAVSELLESVDYEVLGMGVDWIHTPDYRSRPLVFSVDHTDRPSFYIRNLLAHSGQYWGAGTIMSGLTDPSDEPVYASYTRWLVGTRLYGSSMPPFPGHALQAYHRAILDRMSQLGKREGFLLDIKTGPASQRPPASAQLKETVWMNIGADGKLQTDNFYYCDGTAWQTYATDSLGTVDLSSSLAREVIFEGMKTQAEADFKAYPDDLSIFPMDAEDGETSGPQRDRLMADKNWYPEYLKSQGLPFGRPYVLNGFRGLNQPNEMWDPTSSSDTIYGAANYFLHEFDKWIDSLPKDQQMTSTGKSKKELIRCSLQSYNYHDVPPNFNIDRRIRVTIAPFPKHRGMGKWVNISTPEETAKAFHIMLPDSPSGNYTFYSFSTYRDGGPEGIPASWDASSSAVSDTYQNYYAAGFRSIGIEMDLNFGKNGLLYYLASQMLWNARLTAGQLDAIRDRWLHLSFGSAWREMKDYYDFLLPDNYLVNSPNSWAKAIRLLDTASKKIEAGNEPQEERRIDDLKQYWYGHYLMDSGKYAHDSAETKEFLWKGQMSYITGMEGLLARDFKTADVKSIVGPALAAGAAHYTHAETQVWWPKVLAFWPLTSVSLFSDATLANGMPAKAVDLNDLVMVKEFQTTPSDRPFSYNAGYMKSPIFFMTAERKDDPIGFKMWWPYHPGETSYESQPLAYGVDIWNPSHQVWEPWFDKTTTSQQSVAFRDRLGDQCQLVDVKLRAVRAGVYRFSPGPGGNLSLLASPTCDPATGEYASRAGFTYTGEGEGLSQGGVYFYIPKGTKSLDLEVWDTAKVKYVSLYTGLPANKMTLSRQVEIGSMGVHRVPLEPGEAGSLAMITGDSFYFPFLYSAPKLWAASPAALLVPRGIAKADGLTIQSADK